MDVNSGSVHSLDKEGYDVFSAVMKNHDDLRSADKNTAIKVFKNEIEGSDCEQARETLEELVYLTENDELFSDAPDILLEDDLKKARPVIKALCLHVAHDCNLACRYCFAEEGEYHGKRELMNFHTGKKALDFLISKSGGRKNLEVDFFGGEPLMNFEVVKEIVAYGRELEKKAGKHFRFTLTTNGVLLNTEVNDFLNKEMDNVVLSLDGRREVNDKMRPFRNGSGSYDYIVPKFQSFVKSRGDKKYYLRGTYTGNNLDFTEDLLHMADLGFSEISIEPVVTEPKEPYAIRKEDIPRICKEYDKLAAIQSQREAKGNCFHFFHFMIDLESGPCITKRLKGCGSGTEYLAVAPNGDLYPCHQFVGRDEFLMGNVDAGIVNKEIAERFLSCSVLTKKECKDCFAKFYCGGGCMANAWNSKGDINAVYGIGCELERKRVECALMLQASRVSPD